MQNRVMLSGERNKNGEKTKIGLISKKATLHVQPTFFVLFFPLVLHDYNVKLPEASWLHALWRKCTCSCSLFFTFLIISPQLQNFMLFLQEKMSPLFFLSRSSSFVLERRSPVALLSLSLCPSLSLFSKFVDMILI